MDPALEMCPDEASLVEFSAAFDRYGVSTELSEIGNRLGLSSGQQQQLVADWQRIAGRLNQVPVEAACVADSVMLQISADSSQAVPSSAAPKRSSATTRQQLAKIIALATSSVAMLYVSLQVATHERSLNRSAEVLASFSFDPTGWDVVVVTVSDEQADQLSRQLEQPLVAGDLQVLSLLENEESEADSVGVMMVSKETSEKLLGTIAAAPSVGDAEWNPRMVGELGRDELLKRFAMSMKTPTKSDLFFREVIVVTSDQDSGFRVTSKSTDSAVDSDTVADATASDSGQANGLAVADRDVLNRQQEGESVLRQLQNNRRRPVLVVLKRQSEIADDSQGSTVPSPPGFAVYL
ncbi:MAG: hypothetical protein ABJZ55_20090 [Fuerstiella sp.]